MRTGRRALCRLLVPCMLSLAFVGACPAQAGAAVSAASLAHDIAAPWPRLQRADGSFYDYVHPERGGRYSEAMLGLGLLHTGVREKDDRLVATALRAFRFALAHGNSQRDYESVFESYAMAAAYNVAARELAGDRRFHFLRPYWEAWLKRVRPVFIAADRGEYFNKYSVEVAAWLELVRTGLRSDVPGSVLANPGWAAARAADCVNRMLPRLARRGRVDGKDARLFADGAASPLAYHALSVGFYARAVRALGRSARKRARRTLLPAARASLALASPGGDVAYVGRSQEQGWALSLTGYGADAAARLASSPERRALRALAATTRGRLARLHPTGPLGMALTPALATRVPGRNTSLDSYADAPAYAGLTLLALEWSARSPAPRGRDARRRALSQAVLPTRGGGYAAIRTRRVWFVVRGAADPRAGLRADFGLVALAVRGRSGWRRVVGPRPGGSLTDGGAGPVLLRRGRRRGPAGGRLRVRKGVVTARAGWARISYRALARGVRFSWRARRGDRFEYSTFFPRALRQTGRRTISAPGQLVSLSRAAKSAVETGYASGTDAYLWRARMWFRAPRRERMYVRITAR